MLTYEKALIPQNKIKNLPKQAPILKLPLEIFNKMGHFLLPIVHLSTTSSIFKHKLTKIFN
jgi:hypothetical protein